MTKPVQLLLFFSILLLFSCKKETIPFPLSGGRTATDSDIRGIFFQDPDTVYAVGGEKFFHGEVLTSFDGGTTWETDTLANRRINGVSFLPGSDKGFIVGMAGYFYHKNEQETNWNFRDLPEEREVHNVAYYDDNTGIAVGGEAFRFGVIYRLSDRFGNLDTLISLENEMRDIAFLDEETVVAVGYGLVLRSTDGGLNWSPNSIDGDFFFGVHFPTPDIGYIVGLYGMILKTTDGGLTWDRKRKAGTILGSTGFRDVFFTSPTKGYVVGDNGLLWITNDGADTWEVASDIPDIDFWSIHVSQGVGMIAGEDGMVYRFEE